MKFSVLDKQTIQCIMTEAEFADYGIEKEALFQNDGRVQEFFREIMQQAQENTGFNKKEGNVAVHASFLSDESLAITFSVDPKLRQSMADETAGKVAEKIQTVIFKSGDLWNLIRFCKQSPLLPEADLYRYHDVYFILANVRDYGAYETALLFILADEYLDTVCYTPSIGSFIREHGVCMITGHAKTQLARTGVTA